MSAITTNILARKLNEYANDHNINDNFSAIKISFYQDIIDDCDMFLIAPQARYEADELMKQCEIRGIPCIFLKEEEFVRKDIEKIYHVIEGNRIIKESKEHDHFGLPSYLIIQRQTLFSCFALYLLGLIFYGLSELLKIDALYSVYQITSKLVGLYYLLFIGYYYAQNTKRNVISTVFVTLACSLILIPSLSFGTEWEYIFAQQRGILQLIYFSPEYLYVPFFCGITVIVIMEIWFNFLDKKGIGNSYSLLNNLYINGVPICIALLQRMIISLFL